jgi:hypothetical protein
MYVLVYGNPILKYFLRFAYKTETMDPFHESYRYAEQGVQMVMRTTQTVMSSDLSEEEQGDQIDSLRSLIENYIVRFSKFKHDFKLTQKLKENLTKQDGDGSDWPDVGQEFKKLQTQKGEKFKVDVKSHPWMMDFDKLVSHSGHGQEDPSPSCLVRFSFSF